MLDEIRLVVNSVSAAVPAPLQRMDCDVVNVSTRNGRRQDAACLLTVFVGDNVPLRPMGVGAQSYFICEETANSMKVFSG